MADKKIRPPRPYRRVEMNDEELVQFLKEKAVQFVLEDEEWGVRDAGIAETTPYYSVAGDIEAYAFELKAENRDKFTVICGANLNHSPIIQAHKGDPPHRQFEKLKYLDEKGKQRSVEGIGKKRYLYLGAFNYGVEGTPVRGKGAPIINMTQHAQMPDDIVARIRGEWMPGRKGKEPETAEATKMLSDREMERQDLREREWRYLGTHSSWHYGYIDGVPRCEWHSSGTPNGGCSPCSAAMVLGYWGRKGLGTLPYIDWASMGADADENTLQNQLEAAMGTSNAGGTSYSMIPWGINIVLTAHVCMVLEANNFDLWSKADFTRGVLSVKAKQPFVLSVWNSGTYGNHSMCGIGYKYNDGGWWHPWHSMYYRCLTTWAGNGTNWVYVSYSEGSKQALTTVSAGNPLPGL